MTPDSCLAFLGFTVLHSVIGVLYMLLVDLMKLEVVLLVQLNLHLDGPTDNLWSVTSLPQGDGQVLGSVGLKQRNFGWGFLWKFLFGQSQVHCWTLSLCLEQLLKLPHIQVL